jgi:uncharacterized protein YjiS (DUF1127 family)
LPASREKTYGAYRSDAPNINFDEGARAMAQALHYEMTCNGLCVHAMRSPKVSVALMASLQSIVRTVLGWNERIRQRQALAALDDHLLRDIGISRTAAATETSQPFWR